MIATTRSPYLDLGFHQTPPRIISEIKKPTPAWPRDNVRPRISGELLCWMPAEGQWRARRVSVRSGQLQVMGGGTGPNNGESCPRLALRRLNLTQGPNAHSFALRRTQDAPPVLTLQASNQREFDLWVRTIAIELIRQTPLDAIKYLDILTLTPQMQSTPKTDTNEKDCNHNSIPNPVINTNTCTFRPKQLIFNKLDENRNYEAPKSNNVTSNPNPTPKPVFIPNLATVTSNFIKHPGEKYHSLNAIIKLAEPTKKADDDEQTVELLLKKCQNADSYVPVKEKLKLFESLCRLGRIVNNDDVIAINSKYSNKRTRSLHDLSKSEYPVPTSAGVKQICKYFETKNDETKEKEGVKFNTIARGNRTSFGPVKTMISRKYSIQSKNF